MKSLKVLFLFFIFVTTSLFAQSEKSLYTKEYEANDTKIKISEFEETVSQNPVPIIEKKFLLEVILNNTVIKKEGLLGLSYSTGILSSCINDFDKDGNFEIYFTYTTEGSGSYGYLVFYELVGYELISYELPKLNSNIINYYRGHDKYELSTDKIIRSFSAYNKEDANASPTAGEIIIEYSFINSELIETGYSFEVASKPIEDKKNLIAFTIKRVINLPKMDAMSATDSWLKIISNGEIIGKTEVKKDDNSPTIEQTFNILKNSKGLIIIEVYDMDITKNELIGKVTLEKTISGTYPILREVSDGSIKEFGKIEIEFN